MQGVGIDIEQVDRFSAFTKASDPFIKKVYAESEIEEVFRGSNVGRALALRFCLKEAVLKALSSLKIPLPDLKEIVTQKKGRKWKVNCGTSRVSIAVDAAHTNKRVVAFAVAESSREE